MTLIPTGRGPAVVELRSTWPRVVQIRVLGPLVVHRRSCAGCDVGHARYLVEHLPDSRLALLAGADELWFTGDAGAVLDQVESFLAALG